MGLGCAKEEKGNEGGTCTLELWAGKGAAEDGRDDAITAGT